MKFIQKHDEISAVMLPCCYTSMEVPGMNHSNKYLRYQEEDFAKDPFFRSWELFPDEVNSHFWTQWLAQYPEKKQWWKMPAGRCYR